MLVYAKNSRGILYLDRFRIWGRETGREPCDIPFDLYNSFKEILDDATYREGFLSKAFNRQFPLIAFKYSELRYLPEKTIDIIGDLIVNNYDINWSYKKKVDQIKIVLRDKSPCR